MGAVLLGLLGRRNHAQEPSSCRLHGDSSQHSHTRTHSTDRGLPTHVQHKGTWLSRAVSEGSWVEAKRGRHPVLQALAVQPPLYPWVVQSRWKRRWVSRVQPASDSLSTGPGTDEWWEDEVKLKARPFSKPSSPVLSVKLLQASMTHLPPSPSLSPFFSLSSPFTTGNAGVLLLRVTVALLLHSSRHWWLFHLHSKEFLIGL